MMFRSKDAFADDLGVTPEVIKGWIRRHWERGLHYTVIGNQTLVNTEEATEWMQKYGLQESVLTARTYKSALEVKTPIRKQSPAAQAMRVI